MTNTGKLEILSTEELYETSGGMSFMPAPAGYYITVAVVKAVVTWTVGFAG
jgi:hypothetical protein